MTNAKSPTRDRILQAFLATGPAAQGTILRQVYPHYCNEYRSGNSYFALSRGTYGSEKSLVLKGLIAQVGKGPHGAKIYALTGQGLALALSAQGAQP